MNNIIVSVGAVTYAIKLRKLLTRAGIGSKLTKIVDKELGCGYGVEIDRNDLYNAVHILRENGISYTLKDSL